VKKFITFGAVMAFAALTLTAASLAGTRGMAKSVKATLTAAQEVPAQAVKDTKATGHFTGTLTGRKLSWKLTYSGLTGPASAAHIHIGAMGKAGNVLVSLCAPCKSGVKGTTTLTKKAVKQLSNHMLYVNVHTDKNPNGETRGQLSEK
jgi:hypothetical protein